MPSRRQKATTERPQWRKRSRRSCQPWRTAARERGGPATAWDMTNLQRIGRPPEGTHGVKYLIGRSGTHQPPLCSFARTSARCRARIGHQQDLCLFARTCLAWLGAEQAASGLCSFARFARGSQGRSTSRVLAWQGEVIAKVAQQQGRCCHAEAVLGKAQASAGLEQGQQAQRGGDGGSGSRSRLHPDAEPCCRRVAELRRCSHSACVDAAEMRLLFWCWA